MALAQISILLFTNPENLFPKTISSDAGPQCGSPASKISAYCIFGDAIPLLWINILLIFFLIIILVGYRPRVTGILHFWVSVSISSAIVLPDGGDAVAQIVTLLLIPICIADDRKWQWKIPKCHSSSFIKGVSWAFHWGIKIQISYIYLNSAIAKIGVPSWSEGSAVYYVMRGEMFGANVFLSPIVYWLTDFAVVSLVLTWGTIILELLLGVLLLIPTRSSAQCAVFIGWSLHTAIIVFMGLFSFGFIMLGALLIANARNFDPVLFWIDFSSKLSSFKRNVKMKISNDFKTDLKQEAL